MLVGVAAAAPYMHPPPCARDASLVRASSDLARQLGGGANVRAGRELEQPLHAGAAVATFIAESPVGFWAGSAVPPF